MVEGEGEEGMSNIAWAFVSRCMGALLTACMVQQELATAVLMDVAGLATGTATGTSGTYMILIGLDETKAIVEVLPVPAPKPRMAWME
jgi:hypothetical protein